MGISSAAEVIVLNALLESVYVSLHTADPGDTGTDEIAETSYARVLSTFSLSGGNPTVAQNVDAVQFPQATENWGDITHFGLWTAEEDGTFLGGSEIDVPKAISTGDAARWDVGALQVDAD